jgi:hypothetical protein
MNETRAYWAAHRALEAFLPDYEQDSDETELTNLEDRLQEATEHVNSAAPRDTATLIDKFKAVAHSLGVQPASTALLSRILELDVERIIKGNTEQSAKAIHFALSEPKAALQLRNKIHELMDHHFISGNFDHVMIMSYEPERVLYLDPALEEPKRDELRIVLTSTFLNESARQTIKSVTEFARDRVKNTRIICRDRAMNSTLAFPSSGGTNSQFTVHVESIDHACRLAVVIVSRTPDMSALSIRAPVDSLKLFFEKIVEVPDVIWDHELESSTAG